MYIKDITNLKERMSEFTSGICLILAAEKDFNYKHLNDSLSDINVDYFGAFFPGVFDESNVYETGFILYHFETESECFVLENIDITPNTFDNRKIESGTAFILVDGLTGNIQRFLDQAYHAIGDAFGFLGTGAGSLSFKKQPCVFDNNGIYQDAAIICLLDIKSAVGVKHGYERIDGPFIANNVDANIVHELSWHSPFEVYAESVNKKSTTPISKDNFFDISKEFPFGINRQGQEDIIRDPLMSDGVDITCIGEIPDNAALYIMRGERNNLLNAASEASKEALNNMKGKPVSGIVIDCVTRSLFLEEDFEKEVGLISSEIKNSHDIPVCGLLSMGEISTYTDGRLNFYNKTVVSSIFYE